MLCALYILHALCILSAIPAHVEILVQKLLLYSQIYKNCLLSNCDDKNCIENKQQED